jgi:hypothetical protein
MNGKDLLPDKSQLPILKLDVELYKRNNVSIAFLVLISGLIKGIDRQEILRRVKPDYINVPFNRYLYEIVAENLKSSGEIDVQLIIDRIPDFGPIVYGETSKESSIYADYFTLAQILDFQPTSSQIDKAIDMVVGYARRRGIA